MIIIVIIIMGCACVSGRVAIGQRFGWKCCWTERMRCARGGGRSGRRLRQEHWRRRSSLPMWSECRQQIDEMQHRAVLVCNQTTRQLTRRRRRLQTGLARGERSTTRLAQRIQLRSHGARRWLRRALRVTQRRVDLHQQLTRVGERRRHCWRGVHGRCTVRWLCVRVRCWLGVQARAQVGQQPCSII